MDRLGVCQNSCSCQIEKLLKMEGADIKCINCGAPRTIAYEQALGPPALPLPPRSCSHATRTTGFGIDRFIQYLDLKTLQFEAVWLVHSIFNLGEYDRIPKVTIPISFGFSGPRGPQLSEFYGSDFKDYLSH